MKSFASVAAGILAASGIALSAGAASAGTVILEGSDAIGFHAGFGNPGAQTYTNQVFSALGGADPRKIAVVGSTYTGNPVVSGTHSIQLFADLSGAGALSNYAAIYFIGAGGCCTSGPGGLAGRQADVTSYLSGGGTVEIGDYDGQTAWDFLIGGTGHSAFVAGIGGALSGPGCTDGEQVTALGISNGFTQPPPIGCWTHQAYVTSHFAALGFTKTFFDADPGFAAANPGQGAFSSLLSNGSTITGGGGVPEPTTWALMLMGFGGLGLALRQRRTAVAA